MKPKDVPDSWVKIILILLASIIWVWIGMGILKAAEKPLETILQPSDIYLSVNLTHYYFNPILDCIEYEESGGNPNALGDQGRAYGCFQFWKSTFQQYCVEKYSLKDDIWDCGIQRICAHNMIRDGGSGHWTTYDVCNN